jgi:hypothetical protein
MQHWFSRRSVGYVGFSDGWRDLMHNFKMDWEFRTAEQGNIALTGEIELSHSNEFTIAIASVAATKQLPRSYSVVSGSFELHPKLCASVATPW